MMFAVRAAATASSRLAPAAATSTFLSRHTVAASLSRALFSTFSGEDITGTVKFYQRNKAYGFIVADDPSVGGDGGQVFVHRNSIIANDDAAENPFYPFLREKERVRFTVEDVGRDKPLARNLTFEDGTIVPTVRPGYAKGIARGAKERMGQKIYDIFSKGNDSSDEELLANIRAAYEQVNERIEQAQKMESDSAAAAEASSS